MPSRAYSQEQNLNEYVEMLHNIYGPSQNYAKDKFEIMSHLSEVCGIASKYIFKKNDVEAAARFVPKIFGWACALLKAVAPTENDLEGVILRKFPVICSYCQKKECGCWLGEKPTMDAGGLDQAYYQNAKGQRRRVADFALMFERIYGTSWKFGDGPDRPISRIYNRLMEELAEVAESVRFFHLYPDNFRNELADFLAWWFALASAINDLRGDRAQPIEELLWKSYPGHCKDCQSTPCFCPQGPVRELVSKPAPGHRQELDQLTSLRNQGAYNDDIDNIATGRLSFPFPIACVRCDVDSFKLVNDTYGHLAGDEALKFIAGILRAKANPRDRVYRVSGDEFAVLLPDSSAEEAFGMMQRVTSMLKSTCATWTDSAGIVHEFSVGLSIGVTQCDDFSAIVAAFEHADNAAYDSKQAGKGRVSYYRPKAPAPTDDEAPLAD